MDLAADFAAIKTKISAFLGTVPPEIPVDLANEAVSDLDTLAQKAGDAVLTTATPQISAELIPDWNAFLDAKAALIKETADAEIAKYVGAKL